MNRFADKTGAGAVDVIVIGAGHSGLAMSHCLTERGVEHLVLERGSVANSWRHERWDSLRLLTPNWQARLPGQAYDGPDPDGYMTMPELIRFLDRYAGRTAAPVYTDTRVTAVRPAATALKRTAVIGGHGPSSSPPVPPTARVFRPVRRPFLRRSHS
ncbi:MAG: NAD(P)-binding domain-containing protein [Xanthomonadales bacterium]|nr:NAD(P)-binding domain-containing protein [Xanthomonadales bacterium]